MEKQIMMVDATAGQSKEELDAQLVSTLREIDPHNYPYLFERCKSCNVNARQLRFFKKDQLHELIPKSQLGILAEFEYRLNLWQTSKGYTSFNTKIPLNRASESNNLNSPKQTPQAQSNCIIAKEKPHIPSNNQPVVVVKQEIDIKPKISSPAMVADESDELLTELYSDENSMISNAKRKQIDEDDDDDEEQFMLEDIIPELLNELNASYELKNSLSINERRNLCSSIVDYFESKQIEFSWDIMDELAEQIVDYFPTEDKRTWFSRDGPEACGLFYSRLRCLRKKVVTNSASSKGENDVEKFTLETIIPELLKELKDSYESKNSLSTNERRFLCSAIVDYFESRKIKFNSDTMDDLAEQIVAHFPTEDKKSWCNRSGSSTSGRLIFRLRNSCKTMANQTNTSTSKVATNSTSSEDETSKISHTKCIKFDKDNEQKFTLEIIIPELLEKLKRNYKSKNSLSRKERSLLCSSIVDYFVNKKIKFNSDTKDVLAEQIIGYFPTEDKKSWCNRDGPRTRGRFCTRLHNLRRIRANQSTSNVVTNSTSSEDEYDEEQFTLETIIPELLKELKDSYESKDFLSASERSFLCSSIVDYFESKKIKFSTYTMDDLAEQIVEHFPKEDKKSWCNREGRKTSGRFYFRLRNSRRRMGQQNNNTSTSKPVTNHTSRENEDEEKFTLEAIVPAILKKLKRSYESKDFLLRKERILLCNSIVDYFESRKIKLRSGTMADLAEQIGEHFPNEDKKSWYNRVGPRACGSLPCRLYNSRTRNVDKQTNSTFSSKVTLEEIIPEVLKNLKDSYVSKDFLSTNERRLLCSSIVEYFESRKIHFNSYTMDDLAEQVVEHFPKEDKKSWYNDDGPYPRGSFLFRRSYSRRNKLTNNSSEDETSKEPIVKRIKIDEEQFTLEEIIPELLKQLKDSYESNNSLSPNERRLLCSSIVDYFESRKIKFRSNIMDKLAEQISEIFPKEHKKTWYNRDGPKPGGSFPIRLYSSRYRNMVKQTNNTSTSKVATNSNSREPESREEVLDENSKSIQTWLKFHKCETFSEIIDLWEDTMKYRCWQLKHLKDLDSIREFLNDWPSYKLEAGHELLTMDFQYVYPQAMQTFRTRWLVFKQNIEEFLKVELKDVNCIKLLEKYQLEKATINEDSSSCILIYLVHAITKPLRHFEAVSGNVSYAITDSQHSMMCLIQHKAEIDAYTEPYPCIFLVGDSLLDVQECYVVFMDLCYKLSYENCLAVCVQIFTILKVENPSASQCFWEFIRGYMFNIAKDKENFNLAMENMVNYLESVATSV